DANARRIGARHNYWLQLGAGEILRCTGCHDRSSTLPHGRLDSQPPSSNPGAVALGGGLGFPGTDVAQLFATEPGQSMAGVWDFHRPLDNPTVAERDLSLEPVYTDEWHDPALPADAAIDNLAYPSGWTDIPPERALVVDSFDPGQASRIVINYIDHIQPIWERVREARLDADGNPFDTCVGCHQSTADALVPAGQLDLTAGASDIDPDHYTSYRELLSGDREQWVDVNGALGDRQWICTDIDEQGNEIVTTQTLPLRATMRAGSANGSDSFLACFEGGACGPPDSPAAPPNCMDDEGTPLPATRNTVDHVGLLSAPELRLLSEWLDIGAQYFNNPFDDRLAD
ncbi:MAG: hypothetical protein R3228_10355, partial [Halioglobus sp.]|nr:hypothetical protein [Halioglobus sp.]